MLRKRLVFIIAFLYCLTSARYCSSQDLNLNKYLSSTFSNIAILTGQVLGSGLYHSSKIHRFGGFDIGIKTMVGILPGEKQINAFDKTRRMLIPAFQANVGLFDRFEIGGRLFAFKFGEKNKEEVNLTSVIVKYNVFSGFGKPNIALFSSFSKISGISDFSLNAVTIGGVIGYNIPLISVYAGGNFNLIALKVSLDADNDLYPTGFFKNYYENVWHVTTGISLSIAPFTRINAEYNIGTINTVTLGLIFSVF